MTEIKEKYFIKTYFLKDNGAFPNSSLPLIHYKNILELPSLFPGNHIKTLFESNDWKNTWKGGIFEYHHYHSNNHEVLGIYRGTTTIVVGGEKGPLIAIEKGDVLIIPAGVAHKNMGPENSVTCIGAYSSDKKFDMNYGKKGERPQTDINILNVERPDKDPVLGKSMAALWPYVN